MLSRQLHVISYEWIYENLRIFDMPWNSFWTYLVTFLFVDMMYYWFHRAAHGKLKKIPMNLKMIFLLRFLLFKR